MRAILIMAALVACGGGSNGDDSGDIGLSWPQVSGGDDPSAVFQLAFESLTDSDEDGLWEPGESALLLVAMTNTGPDDFNYPGCELFSEDLASGTGEFPFFGLVQDEPNLCSFTVEPLADAIAGDTVSMEVIATRTGCVDDCPQENPLSLVFLLEE